MSEDDLTPSEVDALIAEHDEESVLKPKRCSACGELRPCTTLRLARALQTERRVLQKARNELGVDDEAYDTVKRILDAALAGRMADALR